MAMDASSGGSLATEKSSIKKGTTASSREWMGVNVCFCCPGCCSYGPTRSLFRRDTTRLHSTCGLGFGVFGGLVFRVWKGDYEVADDLRLEADVGGRLKRGDRGRGRGGGIKAIMMLAKGGEKMLAVHVWGCR
jgi:hypothetical protein